MGKKKVTLKVAPYSISRKSDFPFAKKAFCNQKRSGSLASKGSCRKHQKNEVFGNQNREITAMPINKSTTGNRLSQQDAPCRRGEE